MTLFEVLDIFTGRVATNCKGCHRHWGFQAFVRLLDKEVPADLVVHLELDNYATHQRSTAK